MEGGIVPIKLFPWRFKSCRFVSFPIHSSIVPVSPLLSSVSLIKP
uniref:Uncharacterized protein n=1 Tax=Arundo donax TaxID=35708 RepID=A0A0A9BPA2_ARUDO